MTYSTRGTMCGTFLLLALLAGCTRSGVLDTAPNQPPYVSAELLAPDLQVRTGKRAVSYDLTAYFDDTDGDPLEFDASSSDTAVASATVTEDVLRVAAVGPGRATITVTAMDPDGASATQEFEVSVTDPNQPPYVSAGLLAPDLQVRTGKRAVSYDLTEYFDDIDGDPLEFDASSSDTAVASATVTEDVLRVAAVGPGRATITVTAMDPDGASAMQEFEVSVTAS